MNTVSMKKKCGNCGGSNFSISPTIINTGPAVDGRMRMNEVGIRFVVGCEDCSETIAVLTENEIQIGMKEETNARQ